MVNIVYQHKKKNDNNNFNNYSSLIIFKLQTLQSYKRYFLAHVLLPQHKLKEDFESWLVR